MVAISGGPGSLAMAYLLLRNNLTLKNPLELLALHVRLDTNGTTDGLSPKVHSWCADSGLRFEEVKPRFDATDEAPFDCHHLARLRRRTLLEVANARGFSHVALGHHADDVVETWLASLFYTGTPEVLPPRRGYFDGALTVVRPLYELQKAEIERLAGLGSLPAVQQQRGREIDTRRRRIGDALAALGRDQKLVRRQIYRAAIRQVEAAGVNEEV